MMYVAYQQQLVRKIQKNANRIDYSTYDAPPQIEQT